MENRPAAPKRRRKHVSTIRSLKYQAVPVPDFITAVPENYLNTSATAGLTTTGLPSSNFEVKSLPPLALACDANQQLNQSTHDTTPNGIQPPAPLGQLGEHGPIFVRESFSDPGGAEHDKSLDPPFSFTGTTSTESTTINQPLGELQPSNRKQLLSLSAPITAPVKQNGSDSMDLLHLQQQILTSGARIGPCETDTQNFPETASTTVQAPEPVSLEPGMIVTSKATSSLDKPLYEGAKISVKESICSILTYNQTEHCSGVGLRRLLNLVNLHLPEENNLPDTTDKLYDIFPESNVPYTLHYYCNKCWGRRSSVNDICTECDVTNKKVEYFISFSLVSQIQNLFKKEGFVQLLNYKKDRKKINDNNYEDIIDGDLYKEAENILQGLDLTVTWNTDGVSLYESSNFDIWPFYFVINELPPSERFKTENMLLAGIWGSKDHPHPNIFLHPIVDQMKIIKSGVAVEDAVGGKFTIHVYVLCGTCDSPARALFLNMSGHMGYSSCPFCLIKGEKSKRTGDTMVFPHESVLLERTSDLYKHQIAGAVAGKESVEGVKGPSLLSLITMFSILQSTAVDGMHCVFLGVVRTLLNLWFCSTHKGKEFSMSLLVDQINERLYSISVPDFVQRLPLGVDKLSYWKATLYRNFLLYFSLPVLKGIMKDVFFEHFVLFVDAISLLNGSSISEIDILKADGLLQQFCEEFEDLYDVRNMTYNVHLLRHLPECVRRFGPLWSFGCFLFEDLNGRLSNMVHGTNHACMQVARNLTMAQRLPILIDSLSDGSAKSFCDKLIHKWKRHSLNERLQPGTFSVGKYQEPVSYLELLKELLSNVYVSLPPFVIFHRLYHCKQLFVATSYTRSPRVSSHVKYNDLDSTNFGEILTFVRVVHEGAPHMFALVKKVVVVPFNDSGHVNHIKYCIPSESVKLVPVVHLLAVCFKYCVNTEEFLSDVLNKYEIEYY